jgi:hypothetical protein
MLYTMQPAMSVGHAPSTMVPVMTCSWHYCLGNFFELYPVLTKKLNVRENSTYKKAHLNVRNACT